MPAHGRFRMRFILLALVLALASGCTPVHPTPTPPPTSTQTPTQTQTPTPTPTATDTPTPEPTPTPKVMTPEERRALWQKEVGWDQLGIEEDVLQYAAPLTELEITTGRSRDEIAQEILSLQGEIHLSGGAISGVASNYAKFHDGILREAGFNARNMDDWVPFLDGSLDSEYEVERIRRLQEAYLRGYTQRFRPKYIERTEYGTIEEAVQHWETTGLFDAIRLGVELLYPSGLPKGQELIIRLYTEGAHLSSMTRLPRSFWGTVFFRGVATSQRKMALDYVGLNSMFLFYPPLQHEGEFYYTWGYVEDVFLPDDAYERYIDEYGVIMEIAAPNGPQVTIYLYGKLGEKSTEATLTYEAVRFVTEDGEEILYGQIPEIPLPDDLPEWLNATPPWASMLTPTPTP